MLRLIFAKSLGEAVQMASTYFGFGFLVDRVGLTAMVPVSEDSGDFDEDSGL